ncbi:stage VI sporulation protein F [Aneurinibacillus sp. Ricciae_BoGa-3]|uniref:stage VI sporulation protein F n=1 Tax=Aneurinibacillus sp. Ricciae_BoGa-3 TaxID=3022697 RepID=UPI00234191E8|nr:stage VI sporulation protein F [Aneurinibacillus sp. Ricciae_BoGa-3]WCK52501.1 stage VI sporulation protein F [Aneurinibacillus sp. Ricciae_BoGa-3]
MDIDMIIKLINSVPEESLNDDETIKTLINLVAKQTGKTFTDDQLNQFVQQFREFAQEESSESTISRLLYLGGSPDQIDEIKKKFDADN